MTELIRIEIPKGEIEDIFAELHKAERTIYDCYNRLQALQVVTITEKPSAATDGNSEKA